MGTDATTTTVNRSEQGLLLLVLAFVTLGVGAMFLI